MRLLWLLSVGNALCLHSKHRTSKSRHRHSAQNYLPSAWSYKLYVVISQSDGTAFNILVKKNVFEDIYRLLSSELEIIPMLLLHQEDS